MDKNILKEILLEQKELLQSKEQGVERTELRTVQRYIKVPHVVVISGLRRSGKSTLLLQIMEAYFDNNVYYCNFEDERLTDFTSKDFNMLYETFLELFGENKVFFFDEIQNIKGWEVFVRRMYDAGNKIFVTGSNASMLSKEIGTRLTGRYVPIELYPFSFHEYLLFNKVEVDDKSLLLTKKRATLKRYFNSYLDKGGIPEYLKYEERDTLSTLYKDIIYRDIVSRYEVRDIRALRELSVYLLSNTGTLISYNRLKDMLGLGSSHTVKNFIEYLENTYLINTLPMFSYSVRKQIKNPRKTYAIDIGLLKIASVHFTENKGRFLENLVLIELRRRQKEVYYYKTENGLEVDFVIKEGAKISDVIQVTQGLSNKATKEREINSLLGALKELKNKEGIILTENDEDEFIVDNKAIKVVPIYKWLLS
ncbi:MAG: ATP-binding protein [Candidatus Omnitrophica bacterium]|nr:ATP-binding protein [Candidatus Omnitrophota bacterium]MBU1128690.1 ATP-binding protein [Candidatus Omnitrophota bacterium]MBU1784661.1 ATP-binding protein [Candidatus Omnitrophota bacterium]MBU1850820.1 ATP-binding protein [Candidatus Omnitrophota bacterium]